MSTDKPIPSCDLDALMARRERARALCETIETAKHELRGMASDASGIPDLRLCMDWRTRDEFTEKAAMRLIDTELWAHLVRKSGMWSFMDHKARTEFRETYDNGEFPPLTPENMRATIDGLYADRGMMIARGVAELFRMLSDHHKTNSAKAFTRKLIIEHMGETWNGTTTHANHRRADLIDDLDRTLRIVRGLPEGDRGAWRKLQDAIDNDSWLATFDFFTVRLFKKGTGHVVFRHDTDVQLLNLALSKSTDANRIARVD